LLVNCLRAAELAAGGADIRAAAGAEYRREMSFYEYLLKGLHVPLGGRF
jgi:hypothetical protein